jgi:pyruvate dehydrogenase E1 component
VLASTIPNCRAYDPAYAYELTVIIQDGMRRMFEDKENVFYYITTMNENYVQPEMPPGSEAGIVKGLYPLSKSSKRNKLAVDLIGGGTILREVEAAAEILEQDYKVACSVWSMTSANELQREGKSVERWNLMHPEEEPRVAYVTECLADARGPVIAATDYIKAYADQLREFIPGRYVTLGTDGFGRSDTRSKLRKHFEVSREYIVLAALKALADDGKLPAADVGKAMKKLSINPDKPDPVVL